MCELINFDKILKNTGIWIDVCGKMCYSSMVLCIEGDKQTQRGGNA